MYIRDSKDTKNDDTVEIYKQQNNISLTEIKSSGKFDWFSSEKHRVLFSEPNYMRLRSINFSKVPKFGINIICYEQMVQKMQPKSFVYLSCWTFIRIILQKNFPHE